MEALYIIPRQPLPVTNSAADDDLRLADPMNTDVQFTGRYQWSAGPTEETNGFCILWAGVAP